MDLLNLGRNDNMNSMICENEYERMLAFTSDFIDIWNDYIVLVPYLSSKVVLIHKESYIVEKIISVDDFENKLSQFRGFSLIGDVLCLVPCNAEAFYFVNLNDGQIKKLKYQKKCENRAYLRSVTSENIIWCIGENQNNVLGIEIKDRIQVIVNYTFEPGVYWNDSYARKGNLIFFASRNTNKILIIDYKKKNVFERNIRINSEENGFCDIFAMENNILLIDNNGCQFCLSNDFNEATYNMTENEQKIISYRSMVYQNMLIRVPKNEYKLFFKSIDKEKYDHIDIPHSYGCIENIKLITGVNLCENRLYIQSRYGELFFWDFINKSLVEIDFLSKNSVIIVELVKQSIKTFYSENIVNESIYVDKINLKNLIKYLLSNIE